MERINISEIEFCDDYSYSRHGIPYTGVAYECGPNGKLICEITFVDGVKDGQSREWYPTGGKRAEANYKRNTLHGIGNEWFDTGAKKRRTVHEFGILIESDEWDEDGNLVSSYRLSESDPNYKMLQKLRLAKWR